MVSYINLLAQGVVEWSGTVLLSQNAFDVIEKDNVNML